MCTVTSADRPARRLQPLRQVHPGDAHGHALHHLHEVAGGVVGRQQREARAGAAGQALHLALELLVREGVELDLDALARLHLADLRLLEVRDHVGRRRHQLRDRLRRR